MHHTHDSPRNAAPCSAKRTRRPTPGGAPLRSTRRGTRAPGVGAGQGSRRRGVGRSYYGGRRVTSRARSSAPPVPVHSGAPSCVSYASLFRGGSRHLDCSSQIRVRKTPADQGKSWTAWRRLRLAGGRLAVTAEVTPPTTCETSLVADASEGLPGGMRAHRTRATRSAHACALRPQPSPLSWPVWVVGGRLRRWGGRKKEGRSCESEEAVLNACLVPVVVYAS